MFYPKDKQKKSETPCILEGFYHMQLWVWTYLAMALKILISYIKIYFYRSLFRLIRLNFIKMQILTKGGNVKEMLKYCWTEHDHLLDVTSCFKKMV